MRLKFTHFVGSISVSGQFGVSGRFLTILLGVNMDEPFCEDDLPQP